MKRVLTLVLGLTVGAGFADTCRGQAKYKLPPREVIDILDAVPTPMADVSPRGDRILLARYQAMPPIELVAQPFLSLAGLRINPRTSGRQRTMHFTSLEVRDVSSGAATKVKLPESANVTSFRWAPDGSLIAFTREDEHGIELWTADPETGQATVVTRGRLNATLGTGYSWLPGSRGILCSLVPADRGAPPEPPRIPEGPLIQEAAGKLATVRTYQDLLANHHDELLFEYYATSQLAIVDLRSGHTRSLGSPGLYRSFEVSPDGRYLLVEETRRPFSYTVPVDSFPSSIQVRNLDGGLVRTIAELPVADEVPIQGVPTGPRSVGWRPLRAAALFWVEALDGGNPRQEVPHRDRVMSLEAPFEGEAGEVLRLEERYSGVYWLSSGRLALISEYDRDRRWRTTRLVNLDQPSESKVVLDLSVHDRYGDPGSPVTGTTDRGERVVHQEGDWIYLSGSGATPEGDRPILQRMNLDSLAREELFRSNPDGYESFVDFIGTSRSEIITRYESTTEPPNFFVRNLESGGRRALTHFEDPAPELTRMRKALVKYEREDGVPLSGTLYLPPGYQEGERLPVVIWAYPLEYSDASTAGQVRGSPHRFTWMRGASQLFFVTQGYAVLDDAQMPVIGDPETVNDTFVRQIAMAAEAAIKRLDQMGVGDPKRVGVGGHSYGAFMTANLLAHTDLFRAGIARSGAYNRTLTPFGFQSEPRTLWQAPEVYFKVSPFMHADKINEPILLIHGEKDNNSGTFPIQSQRLFHALQGHGATARLVMLPGESHGYRARESVLHTLAEMFDWFDRYVKNPESAPSEE